MRFFEEFGKLSWGWKLLFGGMILIGCSRLACTGIKSVTTDFAQFTSTETPRNAIRNTRRLAQEATGEAEQVSQLNARVAELQQQLAAEQEAHRSDLQLKAASDQRMSACELRLTQMGQTHMAREACTTQCNAQVVQYYNQYCPDAQTRPATLAPPRTNAVR